MRKDELFSGNKREKKASWVRWCLIVLLLAAAGGLFYFSKKPPAREQTLPTPQISPTPSPLPDRERRIREEAHLQDLAALEKLIGREDISDAAREQAAQQMNRMVENHQTELAIEEALQASGFPSCLVVMQGEGITVSLKGAELSGTDGVTILSLCVAHSDVAVENIRIMTGEP